MLTRSFQTSKFRPAMLQRIGHISLLIVTLLALQACYTVVTPPETLPETVTQVVSSPVYVSSIGSPGLSGWDPYWEPSLAYTGYYGGYGGYGASYYSPYNYYDYHHSYYAPVYGGHGGYTTPEPVTGRGYDRDEPLGSGRDRQSNSGVTSVPASKLGSSVGAGMSTVAPLMPAPVIVAPPPTKTVDPPNLQGSRRTRDAKPSPSGTVGSTKEPQETTKSEEKTEDTPKKRVRTRK